MLRKKAVFPVCLIIILIITAIIAEPQKIGRKPFAKISGADIAYATVQLLPPDKTVALTDLYKLADALNDIVVYEKDNSYTDYDGQAVVFTVNMTDGTKTVINAYNPFIVIDGVGYRAKYEPCERLSQLANKLLE